MKQGKNSVSYCGKHNVEELTLGAFEEMLSEIERVKKKKNCLSNPVCKHGKVDFTLVDFTPVDFARQQFVCMRMPQLCGPTV